MFIPKGQGIEVAGNDMFGVCAHEAFQEISDFAVPQEFEWPEWLRRKLDAVHGNRRTSKRLRCDFNPLQGSPRGPVLFRVNDGPTAYDQRILAGSRTSSTSAVRAHHIGD